LPVSSTWETHKEFKDNLIRGGKATLTWEYTDGLIAPIKGSTEFHIRGTNPSIQSVEAEIGTVPWYFKQIVIHEGYSKQQGWCYAQFNEIGKLGPLVSESKYCPNLGYPHGWGIMQVEDPPSTNHDATPIYDGQFLWDWKENVKKGKAVHSEKLGYASSYFKAVERTYPRPVYVDPPTHKPSGVAKTLTALEATTIQLYNGASVLTLLVRPKGDPNVPTDRIIYPGSFEFNPENAEKCKFKPNINHYVEIVVKGYEENESCQ
jgi:hypothetical protein